MLILHITGAGPQYQYGEFQTYPPTVASTPTSLASNYPHPSPHTHTVPFTGATTTTPPQTGDKRKPGPHAVPSAADLESDPRFAAEEDKRRRNTAASARFRVKKKQREQALEKQTKEMSDKLAQLEGKVQQLEMENKWLKGLITDKNDGKMPEMDGQREKEVDERSTVSVKKGVGTLAEDVEDVEASG